MKPSNVSLPAKRHLAAGEIIAAKSWWPGLRAALEALTPRLAGPPASREARRQLQFVLEEPPVLAAAVKLSGLLLEAKLFDEAEFLYAAMAASFPMVHAGHAGLAWTATRRRSWPEALARWDRLIDWFPEETQPEWLAERAAVLAELGRIDEAEEALLRLMEDAATRSLGLAGRARLALRQNAWPEALEWAEMLRDEGGEDQNPHWVARRAEALAGLDRLEEAERLFRGMMGRAATEARGMIGLAGVLARRRAWFDALAVLDDALARFPGEVPRYAEGLRARALFELGRVNEAETEFRRLTRDNPDATWARQGLWGVVQMSGRPQEALGILGPDDSLSDPAPGLIAARLRSLIMLRRLPEARSYLSRLLQATGDPAVMAILFEFVPRLFEGWRRTETWLAIARKVDQMAASGRRAAAPSLATLRLRLFLALRDYEGFRAAFELAKDTRCFGVHETNIRAAAAALRHPAFPDHKRPRIFGIGLPKTGTTTLATALATLGFATLDWLNPLTGELINDDDLHLFEAFTDASSCMSFERYYYMFPNAKFIYTIRQADDWKRSWIADFRKGQLLSDFQEIKRRLSERDTFHFGTRYTDIHMTLYFNHESYAEAFAVYDRRVRRFFEDKPSERFLEFNIFAGDGWPKLCAFADRDVPTAPFPWENRARRHSITDEIGDRACHG
jgi:tetratricopeptide (TPR) repeat protein